MKLKIVFPKAMVAPIVASAIAGCSQPPASHVQTTLPSNSVSAPGQGISAALPKPQSDSIDSQVAQYSFWNEKLDAAYQRLTTHMDLADELALSAEQTTWLNEFATACMQTGAVDYGCAIQRVRDRAAELNARPLPAPVIMAQRAPVPAAPAAPRMAAAQPIQLPAISTPIATQALPAQPQEAAPPPASAAPGSGQIYTVAVTAMPWIWQDGGLNQDFSFGYPNGTPPTLVPLAASGAAPGDLITIKYIGGKIAIGAGGYATDGNGFTGLLSDGARSVLGAFPSTYMRPYPINLGALVGAFTEPNGAIVGQPFAINNGTVKLPLPAGAAQLQLGINDDNFGGTTNEDRNTGAFTVSVMVAKANTRP